MVSLSNDSKISLLGREYTIVFSDKRFIKPRVNIEREYIYVYQSDVYNIQHKTILEKALKDYAKKEIVKRVRLLSKENNFEINKIAVRDQSSRWGSCSSQKNINMNWRLIFAPIEVLDYVIIHELCHTIQMNHSKKFWALVESIMPEWRKYRKWLREKGGELSVSK